MTIRTFIRSAFAENGKKSSYYLAYTLAFCAVALCCFSPFLLTGRSLIWHTDGWNQHFKALLYYSWYLRDIARRLLTEHRLVIPDWDLCLGEGADVLNTLHYYVIGDPIALLSVFVPTRFMPQFYSASSILRLYLAGISFSALCFGTGQKNRYAVAAGSIGCSFCAWALLNAARHIYFLNPMIWFPLMILGMEKLLRREKPYLFIIVTAVSAASNFYFFYMIAVLAAVYALIRLRFLYRGRFGEGVLALLRIGVAALIGVCLAGIILLPVLTMVLNDSRLSVAQPFHWLYPMSYYSSLPAAFVSFTFEYWLCLGLAAPAVPAIFLLFLKKKEDAFLKVLFGVMTAIMLFPIGGRLLNGMSYMTNRWSWAGAILCMFILVREWEGLFSLSRRQWNALAACSGAFFAACLVFERSRTAAALCATALIFLTLLVVRGDGRPALRQLLLIGLAALGTVNTAFWKYAPSGGNYAAECKEYRTVWDEWAGNEAVAVKSVSDSSFTRYSGRSLACNASAVNGLSCTQYFWSLSNPAMGRFRTALCMREPMLHRYEGYDDRTTPTALAAVEYYAVGAGDTKGIPYGYSLVRTVGTNTKKYAVFKNDCALPLVYSYGAYFTRETWDRLDPVQKQEAQLEAAYIDAAPEGIPVSEPRMADYRVAFDLDCLGTEISRQGDRIVTTAKNTKAVLTLRREITNAETYVGFSGLTFVPTAEYDLYFGDGSVDPLELYGPTDWDALPQDAQRAARKAKLYWNAVKDVSITVTSSAGTKKTVRYMQPDSAFSGGRHDFIANLGYLEEPVAEITITFPSRGVYAFDSLDVYSVPMDGFEEKIARLGADTLRNLTLGDDAVTGDVRLDEPRVLCLATPFSPGWSADVDGVETQVYCLNERYPGVVVPAGEHTVRFRYETPNKKAGAAASLLGLAGLAAVTVRERRKKKRGTP